MEVLDTLEAIAHDRYVPPYAAALIHAGLDQRDLALNCLERAFQVRDVHLIFLPIDPKWDDVPDGCSICWARRTVRICPGLSR